MQFYEPKPSLHVKFKTPIWKIEIDNDFVAVETRDKSTHTAAFSSFNYRTGDRYFRDKSPENSWWLGLDRIHGVYIYLHGYKTESSPEHRGIIALDALTGETKWERYDYALDSIAEQGLLVHNPLVQFPPRELLSFETGQRVNQTADQASIIRRDIQFPEIYSLPAPSFIPENLAGPILHIQHKSMEYWAFHTKRSGSLDQVLLMTEENKIILSENLASGIQKLNPEAFFLHKGYLFYIRGNNDELVSCLL